MSDTAFIRIVLVDNHDRNWLIYEKNDLFSTDENTIFQGAAFETSLLDSIIPRTIIAKVNNAVLNIVCIKNNKTRPGRININKVSDSLFQAKNIQLVKRINDTLAEYTLDGRLLQSQSSDFERVDMSGLNTGVYLLKLRMSDGKEYSQRIVKE